MLQAPYRLGHSNAQQVNRRFRTPEALGHSSPGMGRLEHVPKCRHGLLHSWWVPWAPEEVANESEGPLVGILPLQVGENRSSSGVWSDQGDECMQGEACAMQLKLCFLQAHDMASKLCVVKSRTTTTRKQRPTCGSSAGCTRSLRGS